MEKQNISYLLQSTFSSEFIRKIDFFKSSSKAPSNELAMC